MNTVEKECFIEFIEKKSKFLGYVKPISSVREAEEFIKKISEQNFDATHNVYAYKVMENNQEFFKYNDNGEPLNTAGKPMGEIINRLNVSNLVVVATRYFGGIKLGAGGLIRNYAKCAKLAINEAGIIPYVLKKELIVYLDYSSLDELDTFLKRNNIEILDKAFNEKIVFKIKIVEEDIKNLEKINNISIIEI